VRIATLEIRKDLSTAFPRPVKTHRLFSLVLELFFGNEDNSKVALNRIDFDKILSVLKLLK